MPRHCSICDHARRHDVDRDLIEGRSCRDIAAAYGLHFRAVDRHRVNHLPAAIRAAAAEALARAPAASTAPQAQMPATSAHGLASDVSGNAPAITPEPASPVTPVRRRIRALQLTDSPAAPPIEQPATALASTASTAGTFNLYQSATDLRERAMAILAAAERDRDAKTALMAIREARGVLDHMSRLEERQGAAGPSVALADSADWHRTRAAIITALADYPEARLAVAEALAGVGSLQ